MDKVSTALNQSSIYTFNKGLCPGIFNYTIFFISSALLAPLLVTV